MPLESAVAARVCHDLITPFNAINLGLEAFDVSGDKSLLETVKESVNKANVILKFTRELYSSKSETFFYSCNSFKQLISDFLYINNISFNFESDFENIPWLAAKIIMYTAVVAKEIMPYGGIVFIKIDNSSNEIITTCSGKNVAVPEVNIKEDPNHKNIVRYSLLKVLEDAGFEITVLQKGTDVIIYEKMI